MQRGFAHLLLILAILFVLLMVGLYMFQSGNTSELSQQLPPPIQVKFSPTPIPTPPAQVYTDESGQFSFTVPDGFTVKQETEEEFHQRANGNIRKNFTGYIQYAPPEFVSSLYVLGDDQNYEEARLSIWISDNPNNLDAEAFYKKYWYYPYLWGDFTSAKNKTAPVTEETIDGVKAYFGVVDYRPKSPKFIYLNKDGKMYLFRVIGDGEILKRLTFNK